MARYKNRSEYTPQEVEMVKAKREELGVSCQIDTAYINKDYMKNWMDPIQMSKTEHKISFSIPYNKDGTNYGEELLQKGWPVKKNVVEKSGNTYYSITAKLKFRRKDNSPVSQSAMPMVYKETIDENGDRRRTRMTEQEFCNEFNTMPTRCRLVITPSPAIMDDGSMIVPLYIKVMYIIANNRVIEDPWASEYASNSQVSQDVEIPSAVPSDPFDIGGYM